MVKPPSLPPINALTTFEISVLDERKARTEMWRAITKLLEKGFELLVEEAAWKRNLR